MLHETEKHWTKALQWHRKKWQLMSRRIAMHLEREDYGMAHAVVEAAAVEGAKIRAAERRAEERGKKKPGRKPAVPLDDPALLAAAIEAADRIEAEIIEQG